MILGGIYFLACVLTAYALGQPTVNRTAERAALVALYDAVDGTSWLVSTHWMSASVDHCSGWFGVTCSETESAVIKIVLNLRGTLPCVHKATTDVFELE
ncbi:GP46-like surface antigen, putative [Bodo saltans]|uniref:GP46-like surface antigen, putative n=1 Tax=Bodo saltans TaxID=75058 RepID=A0A0S4JMU5_BODSA|nr:GP46-like surface antigen, putative [Bodo saltans]|eukprot:CUG92847.1 GP46-like surface antigen, putative [Bodo saltans]